MFASALGAGAARYPNLKSFKASHNEIKGAIQLDSIAQNQDFSYNNISAVYQKAWGIIQSGTIEQHVQFSSFKVNHQRVPFVGWLKTADSTELPFTPFDNVVNPAVSFIEFADCPFVPTMESRKVEHPVESGVYPFSVGTCIAFYRSCQTDLFTLF